MLFGLHNRRSAAPLVPHGAFAQRPAWGAVLVSFFVGAALIAALVDIPIFARITVADGSQIKAALVLVEFLVALPVGALVGGVLTRRVSAGVVAAAGMVLAAVGFWLMAGWGFESLHHLSSSAVLAMTGLGFGLALAPVNAALLASTDDSRPRRDQRAARGLAHGRHARRHLGADHDRAAPLLRRAGRHPRRRARSAPAGRPAVRRTPG